MTTKPPPEPTLTMRVPRGLALAGVQARLMGEAGEITFDAAPLLQVLRTSGVDDDLFLLAPSWVLPATLVGWMHLERVTYGHASITDDVAALLQRWQDEAVADAKLDLMQDPIVLEVTWHEAMPKHLH